MDKAKAKYLRVRSYTVRPAASERPSEEIEAEWHAAVERHMERWRVTHPELEGERSNPPTS